ncbi:MAG: (2Fe-2S)-binding protein [Pirellulales bacterium]|nr:(2Fe-2S)-binding protein [Pirellulales bacterium]
MPRISIDGREIEVPPGATILDAARRLGIDIPTLCHRDGCEPSCSCLVCVVRVRGQKRFVPSCATRAVEGMEVESETDEVHRARRMALELLLGDHLGDCVAPCELSCPLHMDIPSMLRQIRDGEWGKAIATIKRDIALPAVLGRVCPKPCEKACRRGVADGAVAICALKGQTAEIDLASDAPYAPPCKPDSGRRVAVVGAGPCGLAAAFHLAQAGHRVTLLDDQPQPGGRLRHEFDASTLPRDLLDAEMAQVLRLGAEVRLSTSIGDKTAFDQLRNRYDAVLVCCGVQGKEPCAPWGLTGNQGAVQIEKGTYRTNLDGVFAAGSVVRNKTSVVRSVADGKEAAVAIDAFLCGSSTDASRRPFTVRAGRLAPEEVSVMIEQVETFSDVPEASTSALEEARRQAARCLHCDCRGRNDCRLKLHAEQYDARPTHYQGARRELVLLRGNSGVLYEPGKCIDCGLCIQIASSRRDLLGLTFIGRGFDVRVGVPFDGSLDEALGELAAECVAACPTAALSMDTPRLASELPILGPS